MTEVERGALHAVLTLLEEGSLYEADIQHKVYFIGELSGESFGHFPHLYGPHSNVVTQQLGALVSAGLVEEMVACNPQPPLEYGPERPRWYRLSQDGVLTNAASPESLERYGTQAKAVARPPVLSDTVTVAAKAHWRAAYSAGSPVDAEAVREVIGEPGYPVAAQRAESAVDYLQAAGLAVEASEPEGGRLMGMQNLAVAVIEESAERRAFREWTDAEVAGRWELGRERYHRESIDFKGLPNPHAIEEALDLLVYLWVAKRRRDSGDVDAEWRPMTEESQRGCQQWIEDILLLGDSGAEEDEALNLALKLLRVLWEEQESASGGAVAGLQPEASPAAAAVGD